MTYDCAIVGAGASGLAAAIARGRRQGSGGRIVLLERMPRAGKKILATGNGRCNLGNRGAESHAYHNRAFAAPALANFDCEAFFDSLGLAVVTDSEGRMYPRSNMAASVLDALRFYATRTGIVVRCAYPVTKIEPVRDGFAINGELQARKVIIAAGGCAAPAQGSDGSGFALLRSLGHSIVELRPALVPIRARSPLLLKGLRVRGEIAIERDGEALRRALGEILFTEDGLSGIAAMEVSREATAGTVAVLDLLPEFSHEELLARLQSWQTACPEANPAQLLTGLLPRRVGEAVLQAQKAPFAGEGGGANAPGGVEQIVKTCKRFEFAVTGTRGFAHAQVTAGGADVRSFNPDTMESRLVPGLFACVEVLDVDGGCGGFNLHWAWASGVLAGRA